MKIKGVFLLSGLCIAVAAIVITMIFVLAKKDGSFAMADLDDSFSIMVSPISGTDETEFHSNVFYENEKVTISLQFDPESNLSDNCKIAYKIYDLRDQNIDKGTVKARKIAGSKGYVADIKPKVEGTGWYRIELVFNDNGVNRKLTYKASVDSRDTGELITFAIVPVRNSKPSVDSPFGLDATVNNARNLTPLQTAILAEKTGVYWVRDRLPMTLFPNEKANPWNLLKSNCDLMLSRGMKIFSVIQDCPRWTKTSEQIEVKRLMSDDLSGMYEFAKKLQGEMKDHVSAWEIWNEEDISAFADRPPDHYAAIVKAYSLGFLASGNPPVRILGPLARDPHVGNYGEIMFSNGISAYLDAFCFHNTSPVETGAFDDRVKVNTDLADQYGFFEKPVYISEYEKPYARYKAVPDFKESSRSQVSYTIQAFTHARALGIDMLSLFILRPYVQGNTQYGLLRMDLTPLPVYSALTAMTYHLGDAVYIGKTTTGNGAEINLFDTGNGTTAVVWSYTGATLNLKEAAGQKLEVYYGDGSRIKTDGNVLKLDDIPVFIKGAEWDAIEAPEAQVRPEREQVEINSGVSENTNIEIILFSLFEDKHVKIETDISHENWDGVTTNWAPRGYLYTPGEHLPFTLRVYNFSKVRTQGTITPEVPEGFRMMPDTASVTVDPGEMQELEFTLIPDNTTRAENAVIRMNGEFDGKPVTPSVWQIFRKD